MGEKCRVINIKNLSFTALYVYVDAKYWSHRDTSCKPTNKDNKNSNDENNNNCYIAGIFPQQRALSLVTSTEVT